ncbi:hypothetical protein [Crossiella sp. CA198]|uniref:hypothetical protein n=1 Tax=Crossiella sp. CA198 TaxID=3455607 RepID=UPI003F8D4FD5
MALQANPLFLQTGEYSAANLREMLAYLTDRGHGVINRGRDSLAVTPMPTPEMAVLVRGGGAMLRGEQDTTQGSYLVRNISDERVPIGPASDIAPRVDVVAIRVVDPEYSGGRPAAVDFRVIEGQPATNPVAPPLPTDAVYLALAHVVVPARATAITAPGVNDLRAFVETVGGVHRLGSDRAAPAGAPGRIVYDEQHPDFPLRYLHHDRPGGLLSRPYQTVDIAPHTGNRDQHIELARLVIPDPGFPYVLDTSFRFEYSVENSRYDGHVLLNNLITGPIINLYVGNEAQVAGVKLAVSAVQSSPVLTGTTTVFLRATKVHGDGGFSSSRVNGLLWARLFPATPPRPA